MVLDNLKEEITIQSISTANLGIKFDNHWCNVDAKVWSFFKDAKPGDKYKVKVNDANTIVYAAKVKADVTPEAKKEVKAVTYTTDEVILGQTCLKVAGHLAKDVDDVKQITKDLYSWMKGGGFK